MVKEKSSPVHQVYPTSAFCFEAGLQEVLLKGDWDKKWLTKKTEGEVELEFQLGGGGDN